MILAVSSGAAARHDALVPEMLAQICGGGSSLADQLVIIESLAFGVLAMNRQTPGNGAHYLFSVSQAVLVRLEAARDRAGEP